MDLFVYGTLMVPEVMARVCGYRGTGRMASLAGYSRSRVAGALYPAITPAQGGIVEGILYHGLNAHLLARLDRFEGDQYRRERVDIDCARRRYRAWTYVWTSSAGDGLERRPWSLDEFLGEGLARFLSEYPGFTASASSLKRT